MGKHLTIESVFDAYFSCRKGKRNAINQLNFETDLEHNLVELYHDLKNGQYKIGKSIAFVITHPKIREVWAADFRDRVVHHLIYHAIFDRFAKSFIRDSYACLPERGIHDGMRRIAKFARSITNEWTRPAYFMKADVANFFNSIDHKILIEIIKKRVNEPWLFKLIEQIILHEPRTCYLVRSPKSLFNQVPRHKSFLHSPNDKGLPIGNLTSQFFANIYMNELDQFAKHKLKARYYGRYVDDMIFFHEDPNVLNAWYDGIKNYISSYLSLRLHPKKKHLNLVSKGIDFCGFIIKPGRIYLRQSALANCKNKIIEWESTGSTLDHETLMDLSQSLNSYLGMLRQVNGYKARIGLCNRVESLFLLSDAEFTKILPAS